MLKPCKRHARKKHTTKQNNKKKPDHYKHYKAIKQDANRNADTNNCYVSSMLNIDITNKKQKKKNRFVYPEQAL